MSAGEKEKNRLRDYLDKNGLKLTKAREVILERALNTHGHFTAEGLLKEIKIKNAAASRASVYRAIKEMVEAGIIRETAFGEKHKHFEHVYDEDHHHHARCIRCGRIVEIPCSGLEKKYEKTLKKKGFTVVGHEMYIYGICRYCAD